MHEDAGVGRAARTKLGSLLPGSLTWALACGLAFCAACLETRRSVLFQARDASAADAGSCGEPSTPCAGDIRLEPGSETPIVGGDAGTAQADLCPEPQVLIGYAGTLREIEALPTDSEVISSLVGLCGTLALAESGELVVRAESPLPERGEQRGAYGPWTRACPADTTLIGADARAGLALDQLRLRCARWQLEPGSDAPSVAEESELTPIGGEGGKAFVIACPAGQVARGHDLRAGRWIDAFGFLCARPRIGPEALEREKN